MFLNESAVGAAESVEFGQNCIIITKKKNGANDQFYNRYYRMSDNVQGYDSAK